MQFEIWKGFPKSENVIDENGTKWAAGAIYPMYLGTYEGETFKDACMACWNEGRLKDFDPDLNFIGDPKEYCVLHDSLEGAYEDYKTAGGKESIEFFKETC